VPPWRSLGPGGETIPGDGGSAENETEQMRNPVFIAGATGYLGQRLAETLLRRTHSVLGFVRPGSEQRLCAGCKPVIGNALDRTTFVDKLEGADTYVQLVGVAHPGPTKGQQFLEIDLKSCEESVAVAVADRVKHFIYVSVAHPAPLMKSYIEVRTRCEQVIQSSGLNATILRPWYVLGPGHRWPYLLEPGYWLARKIPSTREAALRLGLVKLPEMISALASSVDTPATGMRIVEVPEIAAHK
jgi:uncharacterized protein YbjT (DUF2867 family)